jgi:hypothetical protein
VLQRKGAIIFTSADAGTVKFYSRQAWLLLSDKLESNWTPESLGTNKKCKLDLLTSSASGLYREGRVDWERIGAELYRMS